MGIVKKITSFKFNISIFISVFFISSCTAPLNQSVIDSFSKENDSYIKILNDAKKLSDTLKTELKKFSIPFGHNMEGAFKKDLMMQNSLNLILNKNNNCVLRLDSAISALDKAKEENGTFINSLINKREVNLISSKDEKQIFSDWSNHSIKTKKISVVINQLRSNISKDKTELDSVGEKISEKYGNSR